ncbi:MAG: terpene cyclase/mutase family protein [Planctomycetaceae bacterium]|nr:terpene cyclase/mutase family protein [Planctomycetaceae bacterium]
MDDVRPARGCWRIAPVGGGVLLVLSLLGGSGSSRWLAAQERAEPRSDVRGYDDRFTRPPFEALSPAEQKLAEQSIDRGLRYLAGRQRADGAFEARDSGQPGITSLAVMAFFSRGETPGQGPYGEPLRRAIDFVVRCQRNDGLLSFAAPEPSHVHDGASHAGNYNHAIAGLMLCEAYGMCGEEQDAQIRTAVESGLVFMRRQQLKPKRRAVDHGGVRYIHPRTTIDADLSVTSWQIMFMRSALNAGFEVPREHVDEAVAYVKRCYDERQRTFLYGHSPQDAQPTRGVAGGGIVCLSLSGEHDSEMARSAGRWILQQSFDRYNQGAGPYHYGAYYCSQGMFQLGGEYWDEFYPRLVQALARFQRSDGSWDVENDFNGNTFGNCYTTALCVLALTPPYQLLPIYQR